MLRNIQRTLAAVMIVAAAAASTPDKKTAVQVINRQPIVFEQKTGAGPDVWASHGLGYAFEVRRNGATMRLDQGKSRSLRIGMQFRGAAAQRPEGYNSAKARMNWMVGNDRTQWRTGVPTWTKIRQRSIYPGVDLFYYGNQEQLEYDIVLAPNADLSRVELAFIGVDDLRIARDGSLRLIANGSELAWRAPVAWQEIDGTRRPVQVGYRKLSNQAVAFTAGVYDRRARLTIDPVFEFARKYGGTSQTDLFNDVAVDSAGNAYVTGRTYSQDFPLVSSVFRGSGGTNGTADLLVAKIDARGDMVWSAVIGGAAGEDGGRRIAIDADGYVYVAGESQSADFPVTTGSAYGGNLDAVALELSPAGNALVFSRFLGGSGNDVAFGVSVAPDRSMWVSGFTSSDTFPLAAALDSTRGGQDGFITKLNASGTPVFSTFWGGAGAENVLSIVNASNGDLWFTGWTQSSTGLMTTGFASSLKGTQDCYIGRITANGSAQSVGTYYGGTGSEACWGIALDSTERPVVVGRTTSTDLPVQAALQGTSGGGPVDALVAKFNTAASALVFSTYLGGSRDDEAFDVALDAQDNIYVTGQTGGRFPAVNAIRPVKGGGSDLLVVSTDSGATWTVADTGMGGDDSVVAIAPDPVNSQVIYAAGNRNVYVSSNRGTSWAYANNGLSGTPLRLAPSRTTGGLVYLTTTAGLFKSTDYAANWTRVTSAPTNINSIAMAGNDTVFLALDNGIIRSTNGGTSWSGIYSATVTDLSVDPRDPQKLVAITVLGISYTTNGGAAWTGASGAIAGLSRLARSSVSADVIFAGNNGTVYMSTDNGATFASFGGAPAQTEIMLATGLDNAQTVYAGSEWHGLFRKTGTAGSWTSVAPAQLGDRGVNDVLSLPGGLMVAALSVRPDAFATKISAAGSAIVYSTYIGGNWSDFGFGVAAGPGGAWYAGQLYQSAPVNALQLNERLGSFDGYLIKISELPSTCAFEVQTPLLTNSASGTEVRQVNVLAPSGCGWTASASASWIKFNMATSGTGTGNTSFYVDPNTSGALRSASVTVAPAAGATGFPTVITIDQAAGTCTYSYSPTPGTVTSAGQTLTATITTQEGCPWSARSSSEWIQVTGSGSGTGSATITYTVAPNTGVARTGTLLLGLTSQNINQAASLTCAISLSKGTDTAPAAGGTGSVSVFAGSACNYTVASSATWLQVTSAASGTGNTILTWTATANGTGAGRTATITIGGQTYVVSQPAAPVSAGCSFTATPSTITAGSSRARGTFTLTALAPNCAWSLQSTTPWIQIYPLSGTGTSTVEYTIYPNLTPRERTGTVHFPGVSVPVVQAGSSLDSDQRFVTFMYFNFLGRMPSQAEVAFHVTNLRGGQTRGQLAAGFYNSTEFNQAGRFIAGLYVGILARDAEFGGWLFQRNALVENIVSQDQLVPNFLNSAEFTLKFGTPTNADFVRLIYRNILLREATDAEVTWRVGLLTSGQLTRDTMARDLLNSTEFRIGTGPRLTTFLLYSCFLVRDATTPEFNTVAGQIQANPAVVTSLINTFASSAEVNQNLN